jgi:CO/xanthine dehydrogenase Mo-binding subunit
MRSSRQNQEINYGKSGITVVGTSPALGGVERVTGAGIYGIDLMLKDQLHGGILRSQYAHAKIVSIDTSEAKKLPGVHAVVTAADAPTCGPVISTVT